MVSGGAGGWELQNERKTALVYVVGNDGESSIHFISLHCLLMNIKVFQQTTDQCVCISDISLGKDAVFPLRTKSFHHFRKRFYRTWGDSERCLTASPTAGNVGGNAAVISSICSLHPVDLKDTTGKDCDSERQNIIHVLSLRIWSNHISPILNNRSIRI